MTKVDRTKRPSEAWDNLADAVNDTGPSVEEVAQRGDELETEPYRPEASIDANPAKRDGA